MIRGGRVVHGTKDKGNKLIDFGQPLLTGFGALSLNPIRPVITISYRVGLGARNDSAMKAVFDVGKAKAESDQRRHSHPSAGSRQQRLKSAAGSARARIIAAELFDELVGDRHHRIPAERREAGDCPAHGESRIRQNDRAVRSAG